MCCCIRLISYICVPHSLLLKLPFQPAPEQKRRRVAGLKNYWPSVTVTEVEQQRMMNVLSNSAESSEERDALLDKSFPGRRQSALKGEDILDMYPRLLEDNGVCVFSL